MLSLVRRLSRWARGIGAPPSVPDALWLTTLAHYPFLPQAYEPENARLRLLAAHFLDQKEFTGAHGLVVTDAMALAIAAQACLPLLRLGPPNRPEAALAWYDDFVGIVIQPDEVMARREVMDEAGVVHHYEEVITGEAMDHGPVMLSWPAVQEAGNTDGLGLSVVIHEFIHKMDMKGGEADGCPPLPPGFMGTHSARSARAAWFSVLEPAFLALRDQVSLAERFGQPMPWLDAYGATSIEEFFPVACEAYFVQRARFTEEWPALTRLFDALFHPREQLA
ncbi:zinc-dependent peptidase [Ottowia thiooxydans]|uniref:M90 family metallopeptidase n=1 Tax=Ottowia thiooxydans TaxID=219182 RepID=UPI00040767DD|nr:M90 family metallopeptidase [Ottowia thiooxydans]